MANYESPRDNTSVRLQSRKRPKQSSFIDDLVEGVNTVWDIGGNALVPHYHESGDAFDLVYDIPLVGPGMHAMKYSGTEQSDDLGDLIDIGTSMPGLGTGAKTLMALFPVSLAKNIDRFKYKLNGRKGFDGADRFASTPQERSAARRLSKYGSNVDEMIDLNDMRPETINKDLYNLRKLEANEMYKGVPLDEPGTVTRYKNNITPRDIAVDKALRDKLHISPNDEVFGANDAYKWFDYVKQTGGEPDIIKRTAMDAAYDVTDEAENAFQAARKRFNDSRNKRKAYVDVGKRGRQQVRDDITEQTAKSVTPQDRIKLMQLRAELEADPTRLEAFDDMFGDLLHLDY